MAVNKVEYGGNVLIDLSGDSITPADVLRGVKGHGPDGEPFTGTFTLDEELSQQDSLLAEQSTLIEQLKTVLAGKAAGSGTTEVWTFTMEDGSTVEKEVVVA